MTAKSNNGLLSKNEKLILCKLASLSLGCMYVYMYMYVCDGLIAIIGPYIMQHFRVLEELSHIKSFHYIFFAPDEPGGRGVSGRGWSIAHVEQRLE